MKRLALLTLCLLTLSACDLSSKQYTPQEMFRLAISPTIPASVKQLQAVSNSNEKSTFFIRFHASKEDIQKILDTGFAPVKWHENKSRFELPSKHAKAFNPGWYPEDSSKHCYHHKTDNNHSYLVIDEESNVVYCCSFKL